MPLTPIPFATLVPSTPLPDGSIYHIVGYGQTLWSIALSYGIQIDQIRAWNNIASDSSDIYVGQYLLVRPANLAVASPTLLGEPEAQQKEGSVVSTVSYTVQDTPVPSSPVNTLTVADLAMLSPTGAVTQDKIHASPKGSSARSGLLIPLLAGGSILIGCALLLILRRNKQQYN